MNNGSPPNILFIRNFDGTDLPLHDLQDFNLPAIYITTFSNELQTLVTLFIMFSTAVENQQTSIITVIMIVVVTVITTVIAIAIIIVNDMGWGSMNGVFYMHLDRL